MVDSYTQCMYAYMPTIDSRIMDHALSMIGTFLGPGDSFKNSIIIMNQKLIFNYLPRP